MSQSGLPGSSLAKRLQIVLLFAGVLCLGGFLWLQFEQHYHQASYRRQWEERAAPVNGSWGTLIGRLRAKAIDLDVVVLHGVDAATLRRAAGVVPGSTTNLAIAAHRDTFFAGIGKLEPGDLLDLETPGGKQRYRVLWAEVVRPDDVTVLAPTTRSSLTLITCYPFHHIGPAPQRYVVRAEVSRSSP